MRTEKLKAVELPFGKIIYQSEKGQSVTSDTANLVEQILNDESEEFLRVLELGSGNGIISIMLKYYRSKWEIKGIEIQKKLVNLSRENVVSLGLKIDFNENDLRSYQSKNKFDLIISNPPFYPVKSYRISPEKERAISRHELLCKMEDVLDCVQRNLQTKGKAYLIYPKFRESDLEKSIKKVDLYISQKFYLEEIKGKGKIIFRVER